MVMITPALQTILDKFPRTNITLLTTSEWKRVTKRFSERYDKFVIYNRKY